MWVSLLIPLYFGLVSLGYRLSQLPIVQDDQRLHLVWLQQWRDPQLFPHDLIARYYQSIQPIGFRVFYWSAAQLGIAPMTIATGLPLVLAVISSVFLYRVTVRLLPHPLAPVLSVLLFNQNIWGKDDLISASPRSFAYLLLILFIDILLRLRQLPQIKWAGACLFVLVLQGLYYPQIMLVSLGVLWLQLIRWQDGRLTLSRDRWRYGLAGAGLLLTGLVLLFFSQNASAFGEIFTAAQMRSMPEFQPGGRRVYFGVNPLRFWFAGASGLRFPLFPPILWAAIGLPFVLRSRRAAGIGARSHFATDIKSTIKSAIKPEVSILAQVMLSSVGLFALAHLTFPLLYLPSRYTFYSSRAVMSIAAGITLTVLLDCFWRWVRRRERAIQLRDRLVITLVVLFAIVVIIVPAVPPLFLSNQGWITTRQTELYAFLETQPKNSVIASLSPVADNVPAFSRRSVLFSPELALPYHSGFYQEMQQRITDVLRAQYSPDASEVKSTIEKYNIRFWIIESSSFDADYLLKQSWLINSSMRSIVQSTISSLQSEKIPVLQTLGEHCSAFSQNSYSVIDANCIVQKLKTSRLFPDRRLK